jgi:protein phosphatase
VKLLTIGEFARLTRLSQKALRLYDELGLLRPYRVDEWSGYRYYAPSQLEAARLVAWLRRLGMPLAQIGDVAQAPPAEAAASVAAFLRQSEADFSERQRLAQFLIAYFSEGATTMSQPAAGATALAIRYAAASDTGLIRERNQDAASAGPRLLAVADGFGPAGDRASAAAIEALRHLDGALVPSPAPVTSAPVPSAAPPTVTGSGPTPDVVPADLLNGLSDAVAAASASVRSIAESDPDSAGSGSTLTAMLLAGSRLALVHIGDTRAYLLRDGGLFQITQDHSVTQSLIDAGRLTPQEADSHPQRALLLRALGAVSEPAVAAEMAAAGLPEASASAVGTPDVSLHDARSGDRYLLCSDGLTSVVPVPMIRQTLADAGLSPEEVVRRLIALANGAGGPDNIACAVADVTAA